MQPHSTPARCAIEQEIGSYEPISNLDRGAEGQNRTADTAVFSRVLYRLSYLGAGSLYSVVSFQAILATRRYTGAVASELAAIAHERYSPADRLRL